MGRTLLSSDFFSDDDSKLEYREVDDGYMFVSYKSNAVLNMYDFSAWNRYELRGQVLALPQGSRQWAVWQHAKLREPFFSYFNQFTRHDCELRHRVDMIVKDNYAPIGFMGLHIWFRKKEDAMQFKLTFC